MYLIDTHTHIYDNTFDNDRDEVINNALNNGVTKMLLPNIDTNSIEPMTQLTKSHPNTMYAMIGLHPTEVREDYITSLDKMEQLLHSNDFIAIGEIGLDFYWDTTFAQQQKDALITQLRWAKNKKLPVSIHTRNAFDEIFNILDKEQDGNLTGVLHCFNGTEQQAKHGIELGFQLGIGGVLTYKNCVLKDFIAQLPLQHLVLETDAPYLPPVPHRGQRNEPAFVLDTATKLAQLMGLPLEQIAAETSKTAEKLFRLI